MTLTPFFACLLGCLAYSLAYTYLFGLRLIRKRSEVLESPYFTSFVVTIALVAATVTAEALVLSLAGHKSLSGPLMTIGTGLGLVAAGVSAAAFLGEVRQAVAPLSMGWLYRRLLAIGLIGGNALLLVCNIFAFAGWVPAT